MLRRPVVVILIVFGATRLFAGLVAASPGIYDQNHIDASFEIGNYHAVADRILTGGERPYRDFLLEYPPGELPFLLAADRLGPFPYRTQFVMMCIAVDALALFAIYRLGRRTGTWWGVVAWLALVPALGPLAYSRTDIFVAAAIVWAVERAHAGRWTASGAWIGLGVAVKLIPALILPAMLVGTTRLPRRKVLAGFSVVMALAVLPFLPELAAMWTDVIGFHSGRGVQGESLLGSLVVVSRQVQGRASGYVYEFGGWDVGGGAMATVKSISNIASVLVLASSAAVAWLVRRRDDVARLTLLSGATLTLLVVSGRVLSPQYMVWLIGAVAVGLCFAPRALRPTAALIGVATLLTMLGFPFLWYDLRRDEPFALAVLVARNLALLAAGLAAAHAFVQSGRQSSDGCLPAAVATLDAPGAPGGSAT